MKKSAKPSILFGLFVFVAFTFLILVYVGVKLECEKLTREKVLTQEKLGDIKNWKINLVAKYQELSSEERITEIAADELGMVKMAQPPAVLTVSKERIDEISKALKKKYE